jgi:poly [ADP-ribose] polymerase 6/8
MIFIQLNFLQTGQINVESPNVSEPILENRIILFLLEIFEIFFHLSDHCCICGNKLEAKCVKGSVCDKKVCLFALENIGVGASVVQEIRRDPDAADLLICLFAGTFTSTNPNQTFPPFPPEHLKQYSQSLLKHLPKIDDLICKTDSEISILLGKCQLLNIYCP